MPCLKIIFVEPNALPVAHGSTGATIAMVQAPFPIDVNINNPYISIPKLLLSQLGQVNAQYGGLADGTNESSLTPCIGELLLLCR